MSKMLVKVEIPSSQVDVRSGTSNRTGKDYEIATQSAYVHLPSQRYPLKMEITLENKNMPYPAGNYELDIAPMLDVVQFGQLGLDGRKFNLTPLSQPATQKAS